MAAHRVLRYLKGSIDRGLFYSATLECKLQAYSDVGWAACLDARK